MKTLYISTIPNTQLLSQFAQNQNAHFLYENNYSIEQMFVQHNKLLVQTKDIADVIEIAKTNKAKIVAVCNKSCTMSLKKGVHQVVYIDKNCEIVEAKSRILIATTNAGKVSIYKDVCKKIGVLVCSLADIKVDQTPEENGADEIENAKIKAIFYHEQTGLPVLANDSGLYIDKLCLHLWWQ